jgi:hypothetical protein
MKPCRCFFVSPEAILPFFLPLPNSYLLFPFSFEP